MSRLCEELFRKIKIYEKNYSEYTKCLIREKEILVLGKPEEKVRQVLLYFLVHESGLFPNTIDIKVEYNYLDVALYKSIKNPDFKPLQPPLMIVEVKREEENLLNHETQILRYLKEFRSEMGLLFNCNQIIVYIKEDSGFTRNYLGCITDIRSLILQSCNRVKSDISEFEKAKKGSGDSFIYLVSKYGKRATHKILFKLKSMPVPIVGCFFNLADNKIYYDIYGKYSRKQKLFFEYQDFESLVSISY